MLQRWSVYYDRGGGGVLLPEYKDTVGMISTSIPNSGGTTRVSAVALATALWCSATVGDPKTWHLLLYHWLAVHYAMEGGGDNVVSTGSPSGWQFTPLYTEKRCL